MEIVCEVRRVATNVKPVHNRVQRNHTMPELRRRDAIRGMFDGGAALSLDGLKAADDNRVASSSELDPSSI